MRTRDFLLIGVVVYLIYQALRYIKRHNNLCMGCSDCTRCRSKFCDKNKKIS